MTRWIAPILFSFVASLPLPQTASAITVDVEPDNFFEGTNIGNAFPGVTLSVEGQPGGVVLAVVGYEPFLSVARNIATTGTLVFGQFPSPNGIGWVEGGGAVDLLRADFSSPADFVQIDLIFDDDDIAALWAYDRLGNLLQYVEGRGDGRGPVPFVTASVSRPTADIAYILAGGVNGETSYLDNLQVSMAAVPEPSTLVLAALGALGLLIVTRRAGHRQSAILPTTASGRQAPAFKLADLRTVPVKLLSPLAVVLFFDFCAPALTQASPIVYHVDFGDAPVNGHSLRVTGTIEADPSSGEIITSNLGLVHTETVCNDFFCEVQVRGASLSGPFPNLNTLSGIPRYHWQATPTELRFFGDSPNWFDGALISWRGSAGGLEDSYFGLNQGFSGLQLHVFYDSRFHHHGVFGPLVDPSVGLLVGTAAVPEPSTFALVSTALLMFGRFATNRKRFKNS